MNTPGRPPGQTVAVIGDGAPASPAARTRRSRPSIWWWELSYRIGPNLWVIPLLMAAFAMVVFFVTRRLDAVVDGSNDLPSWLPEWLVARTPADADVVLSALLAALATALALVFSTSVLTFSMASSQLGPRLIRRFMQDPVTQVTLGAFLSGVLVCALTLGSVRNGAGPDGVPEVSYAFAFVLAMTCFVMLVLYVHRVATTIQSPKVIASVVADLERTLVERRIEHDALDRFHDGAAVEAQAAEVRRAGSALVARSTGFIQGIDHLRLVDLAERDDLVVVLDRRVGQFVVRGTPLLHVLPEARAGDVAAILGEAVEIGDSRTRRQDVEFALYQVVEIGLRALSPAINDTFTGMTCVDWLTAALCHLGQEPAETGGLAGSDGRLRLYRPPMPFERLAKASFDLIRQAGARNPAVVIRILDGLATMASMVQPEHLPTVRAQADLVLDTGRSGGPVAGDEADIVERHRRVLDALAARADADPATPPGPDR